MLKPMFTRFSLTTSAVLAATPTLEPTMRSFSLPSYLPDWKPAALKYLAETAGYGLPSTDKKSTPMPFMPPASSKPDVPGGRMCVAMSPIRAPPRPRCPRGSRFEDAARGDARVLVALEVVDLVEVGRLVVQALVPVRMPLASFSIMYG